MSNSLKIKGFKNLDKKIKKEFEQGLKNHATEVLKTKGIEITCPFCEKNFTAKQIHETCPNCLKTIDVEFNVK